MEISEIKQLLPIQIALDYYKLKPTRNNLINCPFHKDDKPSLQIYPQTNTWHCFGCGKGTDTIDLIKYIENCTTHEAILKAKTFLIHNINSRPMEEQAVAIVSKDKRILGLSTAFQYFTQSLKTTTKAQEYLRSRNIDYTKITSGYDNNTFHQTKRADKELQQLYSDIGLIYPDKKNRKETCHSRFDGCIVFPAFDEQENIVSMYGRKTDVKEREGGHYKLPGDHQGLYPKYPEPTTEILLITECIIDAATLLQHPFIAEKYTILSLYGAKIWTEEHTKAIRNLHQLKEIIFALDGDKEGKEGTAKHSETVKKINTDIKISYIEIPDGEDINSIAQSHENPQVFTEYINNREPINNTNHFFLSQEKKENGIEKAIGIKNTELTEKINGRELQGVLNTSKPDYIRYETETIKIKLCGGMELYNLKRLRVTLNILLKANIYRDYRDTIDLYSHVQRKRLIQESSQELEVSTTELSQAITELTNGLENYRNQELEKKKKEAESEKNKDKETFTQQELRKGAEFLTTKDLMEKTCEKIRSVGLVGEEEKGMLLFFILLTRMFKEPLHALVQGKSGSGKTYLLKKIAGLLPKAHVRIITALTENTLYHSIKGFWNHVVLLIEDLDGAFNALLPLREMMTNQSISKLSTEKDIKSGEFVQKLLYVEGPICVSGATTKDKLYEDNANRSFLIQVNESREHQERVLEYQRKEIAGLLDKSKEQHTQMILKTAQLHLEHLEVVIPFGNELRIPDHVFKKLRTNAHYLTLIKAIAFWNQKQREINQKSDGTRYIEATLEDVMWANKLSKEVLLRKSDELNGALRGFFESVKSDLSKEKKHAFFASQVRHRFRMHPQQLKRYLIELTQRGYLKQIGRNQKTGYEYEIVIWNDYEVLQNGISMLDKVLENLKAKYINKQNTENEQLHTASQAFTN